MNSKVQDLPVVLRSMLRGVPSLKASSPTLIREESSHVLQRPCLVFGACALQLHGGACNGFFGKQEEEGKADSNGLRLEQASEANDELLSLSFLLLTLEVLQSLFGLNCAGIRNNRAVISQSG